MHLTEKTHSAIDHKGIKSKGNSAIGNKISGRLSNYWWPEFLFGAMAAACFLYALYIAVRYANQVPLDGMFSFRQMQTALSAFWLKKNGFSLAYETPVGGMPWSIPFEFPLYQYIVALTSELFGCSLDATGRIVSFIFMVLCILPARSIIKNLNLSRLTFPVFALFLFSSPFYLYWGRTFMIETTTLFFTIAGIKYFIDIIQSRNSYLNGFLFVLFVSLGILQKATTTLPVLAILCFVYMYWGFKRSHSLKEFLFSRQTISTAIYFGIPLAVGAAWTIYTDHVKMLNELGTYLTSSALSTWNWGTLEQRLSAKLYHEVIWDRIFRDNLWGLFGLLVLIAPFFSKAADKVKLAVLTSLAMGILPFFLFTNLHLVHNYYQSANIIYFIFAFSVSLAYFIDGTTKRKAVALVLCFLLMAFHISYFFHDYLDAIKHVYNTENTAQPAVSQIIKNEVPEGKYFVAYGNDWNSSLAYLSERKSFTAPQWIKSYDKIAQNPENYLPERDLGAVLLCTIVAPHNPSISYLIQWSTNSRHWKIGEADVCLLASPEIELGTAKSTPVQGTCEANIELAGSKPFGDGTIQAISGWISQTDGKLPPSDKIYISLTRNGADPIYLEALKTGNKHVLATPVENSNITREGFSRLMNSSVPDGDYQVGIGKVTGGHLEACRMSAAVSFNVPTTEQ